MPLPTFQPDEVLTSEELTGAFTKAADHISFTVWAHNFITPGMQDKAPAIQAAIDLAVERGGGEVRIRAGDWYVASTIVMKDGVILRGQSQSHTRLVRDGAYGDTIRQEGGCSTITDLWLWHAPDNFSIPVGPLPHLLTDGSAHIRFINCQEVTVERLRAFRMPYGIVVDGTYHSRLRDVWTFGLWNDADATQQEGMADVAYTGTTRRSELAMIDCCYFSGRLGPKANFAWTDGGGNSVTAEVDTNIGRLVGIDVHACEGLVITNTYIGRNAANLVHIEPRGPRAFIADVQISNCFFDDVGMPAQGGTHVQFAANAPGLFTLGVSISNCTFNGEYGTIHGIYATPPTVGAAIYPNVCSLTVTGNTFFAHVGAPIRLHAVRGAVVSGNTISAYNARGVTPAGGDLTMASGVWVGNQSHAVYVAGNTLGGGGNGWEVSANNYCHYGVSIDPSVAGTCFQSGNVNGGVLTTFSAQQVASPLVPTVDNAYLLGTGALRFSGIFAANGLSQTSGVADKLDIAPLPDSGAFIDAVQPITYRMKVGGQTQAPDGSVIVREGIRTHWGFAAHEVKAAADAYGMDCGAYVLTEEGKEMLRPDELLPVVWDQARRQRALLADYAEEIQQLKARVASLEG